ncbi:MAG: hypothetical protein O3A51_04470 [Verrucomicrobia bacterium]|nr:hypothetical protein [Verrucomicrobiota bacterium]
MNVVDAAIAAGMPVLAVGSANTHPRTTLTRANLAHITIEEILSAH